MTSQPNPLRRYLAGTLLLALGLAMAIGAISCQRGLATQAGWNKSFGPVVPHDTFPADCRLCHAGTNWTTLRSDFAFDHEARTGVPLRGAHKSVACLECHNDRGPVKRFADQGCAGCHVDPHRTTLGRLCADCHNEQTWRPKDSIARHNRTRFALVGAHASVACFACHPGAQVSNFSGSDTACFSCHQKNFANARAPNHVAQGFSNQCQTCHTPTGWRPAFFRHIAAFPLTGGHSGVECAQCHKGSVFFAVSTECVSCHLADFRKTRTPNHVAAGFSTDCTNCHTTRAWQGARFVHTPAFPLTGGHAGVACASCHRGSIFRGLPADCVSCHLKDYLGTRKPNHAASGFSQVCSLCHTIRSWTSGQADRLAPAVRKPHHK